MELATRPLSRALASSPRCGPGPAGRGDLRCRLSSLAEGSAAVFAVRAYRARVEGAIAPASASSSTSCAATCTRPRHPEIIYITGLKRADGSALGGLGTYEVHWHHDQIYRQRPATGPSSTPWRCPKAPADLLVQHALAYAALPEHCVPWMRPQATCKHGLKPSGSFQRDFSSETDQDSARAHPTGHHRMVLENPGSGERSLYLDPEQDLRRGRRGRGGHPAFLDEVFSHVVRDEFIYTHAWRNGDVVMWDNARLMHRRDAYDETRPPVRQAYDHLSEEKRTSRCPSPRPQAAAE